MTFRFSGLWLIKILKVSDIGPEIKPEAELGSETFVPFQNFSQARAAKAQAVSYIRVFGGLSLIGRLLGLQNGGNFSHLTESERCESFLRFYKLSIKQKNILWALELRSWSRKKIVSPSSGGLHVVLNNLEATLYYTFSFVGTSCRPE